MTDQDVFTTATAGLKEVLNPRVLRLWDGDRLDLDISPVRKSLRGADLRMLAYNGSIPGPTLHVKQGSQITVHTATTATWRRRCTGTACGWRTVTTGSRTRPSCRSRSAAATAARCSFPTPASTGITSPADAAYWPDVDRQLSLTLDDLLVEDGQIAPFHRSGPKFTAMGRYGNELLINGETAFTGEAIVGESYACTWSTPRTRESSTWQSAEHGPS